MCRYADLVDTAGTSRDLVEAAQDKATIDTAAKLLQLNATATLDSDPALGELTREPVLPVS